MLESCRRVYLAGHVKVFEAEIASLRASKPPIMFMKYFESYWLGKNNDRATRWAVCFRTSGAVKYFTNNMAETAHAALKRVVPGFKLNLADLLAFLRAQLDFTCKESVRIIDGRVPPKLPRTLPSTIAISSSVNGIDSIKLVCSSFKTVTQPALTGVSAIATHQYRRHRA